MGSDCFNSMGPLGGHSLLSTVMSPGVPGTHFVNLGRIKGSVHLEGTQWFWTRVPPIGNSAP